MHVTQEMMMCDSGFNQIMSKSILKHMKCFFGVGRDWKKNEKANSCIEKAYEMNPRNDKTAFEYAEYQAGAGNIEFAKIVFEGLIDMCLTGMDLAGHLYEKVRKDAV